MKVTCYNDTNTFVLECITEIITAILYIMYIFIYLLELFKLFAKTELVYLFALYEHTIVGNSLTSV